MTNNGNSNILFSQGTAVIFNAVGTLPENTKKRVVGVALYGYTHNKQNKGIIPNFPAENVKTFCPASDGVCGGMLNVNAGHFSYLTGSSQKEGYTFLAEKIKAAQGGGGSSAAAAPAAAAESGGDDAAAAAPAGAAAAAGGAKPKAKGFGKGGKGGKWVDSTAPPMDERR